MADDDRCDEGFLIAQLSDIHCGDGRFRQELLDAAIAGINAASPDLVVVPGDLTAGGYREQFEEAVQQLGRIECPRTIVIAGNHDCRNVGYLHFEEIIGPRQHSLELPFGVPCSADGAAQETVRILALDSNKPDLNDGEIGRRKQQRIVENFAEDGCFKVMVMHHHLVSVPGTGRERNIVWDAGDVLEKLMQTGVDIVLAGHRHVPYVWPVDGMLLVTSGTSATGRTRGMVPPSYNLIRVTPDGIAVSIVSAEDGSKTTQTFPRRTAAAPPA